MSLLSICDIPVTRYHCDFRLTNTVLSPTFAQQHNLDNTDTISLTIKVKFFELSRSRSSSSSFSSVSTFLVKTLPSHYCPPGSQVILGRDVQAACIKASEPDLPDTLQQSSSTTQPSATAFRENPGVAENLLTKENTSEHRYRIRNLPITSLITSSETYL
ncbi:hypothetical protein K435DRAFT_963494 [Dendrothele bispora CBS 962.96]|uniref:Uncharacterized protein n=1 Tax=Dendrothele bispora (strain CBS 962.96) TaxID=1314807 RepID=A0A4V4HH59_DENBC|nr:hypothetical protein K435DRAFT_963494 [Dendrothele bispora CBS 962.96]